MEPRPPETDLERIATMQPAGLPFDLAIGMTINWEELENDVRIRGMVAEYPAHRPIEKLALVALAYYRPEKLLGEEVTEAIVDHVQGFMDKAGAVLDELTEEAADG